MYRLGAPNRLRWCSFLFITFLSSSSFAVEDDLNCPNSLGAVAKTTEQRIAYEKIHNGLIWKKFNESESDYRRFISKQSYDEKAKTQPPASIYGTRNYIAWRKAADYLDSIPQGKFEMSLELFSKVHELSASELFPVLTATGWVIPSGLLPTTPGAYKRRPSLGRDPIFEPLTEEQFQAIKKNPWLSGNGLEEIPGLSKPNARRGIIHYANASETKPKLEKLIHWYNENRTTMDPVELAARFQQAFVSIHPFIDGNGRTSRLLMDRILAEHGLPPPLLASQADDIYLSPEAYTLRVRDGIDEYLRIEDITRNEHIPSVNRASSHERVGLGFRPSGDPKTVNKPHKYMSINDWGNPETFLGGQRFVFTQDGFFYSPKGIPHVYHEGALYPITDKSYHLYMARNEKIGRPGKLAKSHRDIYRRHFGLLRKIEEGKIDPLKIKLVPYSTIEKANKRNEHQLYEWQKPAFLEAVNITVTDPKQVLIANKLPKTNFETDPNYNLRPSDILAQYEFRDLEFWKHLNYAKRHYPEAVPVIWESRKRLWEAGRTLLTEYLKDREEIEKEIPLLRKGPAFHLWDSYFQASKLSYETFEKAVAKTNDKKMALLRSDTSSASIVGFRSQGDYQRLLEGTPGYEKLRAYLAGLTTYLRDPKNTEEIKSKKEVWKERIKTFSALVRILPGELKKFATDFDGTFAKFQMLQDNLLSKTMGDKYRTRGASAEFDRAEIDYRLHATGSTPSKEGTSFTTQLSLLLPGSVNMESLQFSHYSTDASLFLVKAPKHKIEFNHMTYADEYEVLGMKPIYPWEIAKRYQALELTKGRADGLSEKALAFLKKYNIGTTISQGVAQELRELTKRDLEAKKVYDKAFNDHSLSEEKKAEAKALYEKTVQEIYSKKTELMKLTELPPPPKTAEKRKAEPAVPETPPANPPT